MRGILTSVKYTPDRIPYHTLKDFQIVDTLGGGGYGVVQKGYGTIQGSRKRKAVAIKSFTYTMDKYYEREIQILKQHNHPNIIVFFGVIWDGKAYKVIDNKEQPIYTGYVMEYMERGSLHRGFYPDILYQLSQVIHDPSETYDNELIKTWIRQIAAGLQYLHKNGIIHRDVKPHNILLAARDHLKLADFGLARTVSANHTYTSGIIGTDPYMAPEVIGIEKNYGPPADIYSLGATIWEIVTRQKPRGIFEIKGISSDLFKLIKKCLQQNVSDRPSINEVIESVPSKTILLVKHTGMTVLSADRSEWTTLELDFPIFIEGSVCLNEEIHIIGGNRDKKCLYKLDKTLKWIRLADMNIGRHWIRNSCLEWNGFIWVFGGMDKDGDWLKSVERYDPKTNKWKLMPDMKHPRCDVAATVWNDRIIVSGGQTTDDEIINSVECFSPENGTWTELPSMPKPLYGHTLVSYKSKIIAMGGIDYEKHEAQNTVYELDPLEENPAWKSQPPMKYPAVFFCGIVFDDEIYVIGGLSGNLIEMDRVEIFDGEHWRDEPTLPIRWSYSTSAIIIPQHLADRLCNHIPK